MVEGIPFEVLSPIGATGILALTVLLILVGHIIPRRTHEEVVGLLKEALTKEQERSRVRDDQIAQLLDSQSRVIDVLDSIHRRTVGGDGNDAR